MVSGTFLNSEGRLKALGRLQAREHFQNQLCLSRGSQNWEEIDSDGLVLTQRVQKKGSYIPT